MATSPLPSRGPTSGRECYITLAFSGIPKQRGQNQNWLPHACMLGGPQEGGNATSPLRSRGSPNKGGQNQNWVLHPCLLRDPPVGRKAIGTLHSWGSQNKGGQNQKWPPLPCLLGGPQVGGNATSPLHSQSFLKMGIKSEMTTSPVPSRGPKSGQKYDITLALSGIPKPRVKNQKWLPLPYLLRGPQVGENAT